VELQDREPTPVDAATLIARVQVLARERRPDDDVFVEFVGEYLCDLPEFDLDDRRTDYLYAASLVHFSLGRRRSVGETLVAVRSPDVDRDGWHSDRSVVLIVTDDRPFLVDTVRIVLERHGVNTHLLVHPMLSVIRDSGGIITRLAEPGDDGAIVEAWTQVEIDRCDGSRATALADDVRSAVDTVHRVVSDFEAMRARMAALSSVDALLPWFAEGHFVFLGAATYLVDQGRVAYVHGSCLGLLTPSSPIDPPIALTSQSPLSIARSRNVAMVHRSDRMTAVTVRTAGDGGAEIVQRFVGLLSTSTYRQSVLSIPSVGDRARGVLGLVRIGTETHVGRSMRNVLEGLPRELVFELDAHDLAELVIDVVGLQERQIVRVFAVPEPTGTAATVMVYLPKSRFTAQLPELVARHIAEAFGSAVRDVQSLIESSSLARITMTVIDAGGVDPDLDGLSEAIDRVTTSWIDRIRAATDRRERLLSAPADIFQAAAAAPAEFRSGVDSEAAVGDLDRLAHLASTGGELMTALTHQLDAAPDEWRVRLYRRTSPVSLSRLLPLLGHLGLDALEEHPYEFVIGNEHFYLLDIGVRLPSGASLDPTRHAEVLEALDQLLTGVVEADGFNQLVLMGGLTTEQIVVLRSYAKYAQQTTFPFSQGYVEGTLSRLPTLARLLVELFATKFDPDRHDADRPTAVAAARAAVTEALDRVPSLDDDRICRTFLNLIDATVRTSAYQAKPTVAFKFDPSLVPDLPEPRPAHEIFVCSPRVEGVHLRAGAIARGGLRWSDRPEDYRTEVLGLVKAQMVKNAVIVPVGAKGGFVVKQPKPTRPEQQEEGIACYRLFVSSLLDLTDNVVADEVVPPPRTVRYDGDDPYLVVAADKGTATFSDIANAVAAEYHFWLDDAFASGGSAGYDHKAMGITARGAWESVKRHGAVLGINPEVDVITVVGIGDMSGDVFGNGLLRSRTVKLVAAFDHRHIFVDPNPDPGRSFDERRRLFDLPRSSWADYDPALISAGGGVFERSAKSIETTPEMRAVLGMTADQLPPSELITAILKAPVDLLWNGGIGTYVKASTELNSQVGDRANDALRVNGNELRCRMVGEGGNLGVTQLGRVEYAILGGLIYTDAIDNSAGVDTSDHEVNIKILLRDVTNQGRLTLDERNDLLASMTDEVAELVLDNNRAQTLALQIARTQGLPMVNVHARYLDQLELEGFIDRSLEFLPTDKQIAERQAMGSGLRAPELAVLIAYTKNVNVAEIIVTDLPEDPALVEDLINYFPTPLRDCYRTEILRHRLRREIAITQLMNQMVNLSGISYDHRMTEDTGALVGDVARAWVAVREVLDFPSWWDEIAELEGLKLEDHLDMYLDCRRTAERCSLWFLRNRRPPVNIAAEVEKFHAPIQELSTRLRSCLKGPMARAATNLMKKREAAGVPTDLAERSVVWRLLHTAFDVIEIAEARGVTPVEAALSYWEMFERLELLWLWDAIGALPRSDRWQTQARGALRDDLLSALAALTSSVLDHPDRSVAAWMAANGRSFDRAAAMLTQIRRTETFNITNLSVALRQLRNLSVTSVRG
jgi:glutamate dehydrogenase